MTNTITHETVLTLYNDCEMWRNIFLFDFIAIMILCVIGACISNSTDMMKTKSPIPICVCLTFAFICLPVICAYKDESLEKFQKAFASLEYTKIETRLKLHDFQIDKVENGSLQGHIHSNKRRIDGSIYGEVTTSNEVSLLVEQPDGSLDFLYYPYSAEQFSIIETDDIAPILIINQYEKACGNMSESYTDYILYVPENSIQGFRGDRL